MEENVNLIEMFYQPNFDDQAKYNNPAFQILEKNKIDTNEILGLDRHPDAGEVQLNYKDNKEKEVDGINFAEAFGSFLVNIPKDTGFALMRGGANAAELSLGLAPLVDRFLQLDPNYKPNADFETKINSWKKNIGDFKKHINEEQAGSKFQNKASHFLAMIMQDVPFAVPIHKKLRKIGVPNTYAVPLAYGIGGAIGFDEDFSLFLNSENMNNFKTLIKIAPDTPEEVLYDNVYQAFEGTALGILIPGIWKGLKFAKRNFPKSETVTDISQLAAGSAVVAGSVVATKKAKSDNLGNNTISKLTENK